MTSLWAGLIPRQLYHIVSLMYRHLRDTTLEWLAGSFLDSIWMSESAMQ